MSMAILNEKQEWDAYAWPGGYPLYYVTRDSGVLCPTCANENRDMALEEGDDQWYIVGCDINWEDVNLYCDNCSKRIESAYGEPNGPDDLQDEQALMEGSDGIN